MISLRSSKVPGNPRVKVAMSTGFPDGRQAIAMSLVAPSSPVPVLSPALKLAGNAERRRFRPVEARDSQRFAGPWPRVLELLPGRYDVMAFRGGYRTWSMRLAVEPDLERLITWRIELPADDIYAD